MGRIHSIYFQVRINHMYTEWHQKVIAVNTSIFFYQNSPIGGNLVNVNILPLLLLGLSYVFSFSVTFLVIYTSLWHTYSYSLFDLISPAYITCLTLTNMTFKFLYVWSRVTNNVRKLGSHLCIMPPIFLKGRDSEWVKRREKLTSGWYNLI